MSVGHTPVLVAEVVSALALCPNGAYLDATFGGGGHTQALLEKLDSSAQVFATDRDPNAISLANELAHTEKRLTTSQTSLSKLLETCKQQQLDSFCGILFDLGVSSMQLDSADRGFSFREDGPLDMRMDPTTGTTAADWLNTAPLPVISSVLSRYGEERNARQIAKAIVDARPLSRTAELVDVVDRSSRIRDSKKHIATRVFQAVRIHINDELNELREGLRNAFHLMAKSGRLAVISFHSLEHKIVRRQFSQWTNSQIPSRIPIRGSPSRPVKFIERGLKPSRREIEANPRARSALLQVIERVL